MSPWGWRGRNAGTGGAQSGTGRLPPRTAPGAAQCPRGSRFGARPRERAGTAAPVPAPRRLCGVRAGVQASRAISRLLPGSAVLGGLQRGGCPRSGLGSVPRRGPACSGPVLSRTPGCCRRARVGQGAAVPVRRAAAGPCRPAAPGVTGSEHPGAVRRFPVVPSRRVPEVAGTGTGDFRRRSRGLVG